eukprot:524947_1
MDHSQLKIDLQIDNHDKNMDVNFQKNTLMTWTKTISRNLKRSGYTIEVIDIHVNDSGQSAQITMSVNCDTAEQAVDKQNNSQLEMEIFLKDRLKQIHFAQEVQELCHLKNFPKIYVTGRYTDKQIHDYQTKKFEEKNNAKLQYLKYKIIDQMKPLYTMTVDDICDIIKYWFLSDIKYTSYRRAIVNAIKMKSINGIAIKDRLDKQLDISTYLKNVIGE